MTLLVHNYSVRGKLSLWRDSFWCLRSYSCLLRRPPLSAKCNDWEVVIYSVTYGNSFDTISKYQNTEDNKECLLLLRSNHNRMIVYHSSVPKKSTAIL